MSWTKVLAVEELPEGERQVVQVSQRKILLLNHEGKLHAVDNTCPHLKLPMKKGKVTEDGTIVCPWHRSAFDICTGEVKSWTPWPPVVGKVLGTIKSENALPVFPVRVEEGSIWIDIT